jgi:hypothetical protein
MTHLPRENQQPVHGQPYGVSGGYAQPPTKKAGPLKILLITFAVIVGICMVGGMIAGLLSKADDAGTPAAGGVKGKAKAAGMNTPVRDGKFQFTVTGMQCGAEKVGSGLFQSTAQGSYCVISVQVRNVGEEAQSFSGSDQKALDAKGVQFSNDGTAEFNVNSGSQTWADQINPGNGISGKLVFDVPAGTKLTHLELHDSFLSGGVKVALT